MFSFQDHFQKFLPTVGGQLETAGQGQGVSYGKGSSGGGQAGGSGSAGQYGSDYHHHQGSGFGAGGAGGPGVQAGRGGAPGTVGIGEPGTGKHSHKYLGSRNGTYLGYGKRENKTSWTQKVSRIHQCVCSTHSLIFKAFFSCLLRFSHRFHPRLPLCYKSHTIPRMLYLWLLASATSLVVGYGVSLHYLLIIAAIIWFMFSLMASRWPGRWRRKTYHCVQDLYFPMG